MKKRKICFLIFFLLLLWLITISCGGGGGGSERNGTGTNSRVPTITDVRVFRPSAPDDPIDPSSGPIIVNLFEDLIYKVYYTDSDSNVDLLYFTGFYPSTSTESTDGFQVENIGQSPDTFIIVLDFFRYRVGEWRLEFQLEDSSGNKSNIFDLLCEARTSRPDDPKKGTAPLINDVRFFRQGPPEEPIDSSNGSITVTIGEKIFYKIFYEDPDLNIDTIYRWGYYPSTSTIPTIGPLLIDVRQSAVGDVFTSEPEFFGFGEGEWQVDFLLEDSFKNQSGIFTVYFNVIAP